MFFDPLPISAVQESGLQGAKGRPRGACEIEIETVDDVPPQFSFSLQRVAEVRRRIEEGTYQVDIARIADRMASRIVFTQRPDDNVHRSA